MCGVCFCGSYDEDGNPVNPKTETVDGIRPHTYPRPDDTMTQEQYEKLMMNYSPSDEAVQALMDSLDEED